MVDFYKIISFENLYKAHRRARLSKRHKKEVVLFEANLSKNLWELHYDLKYGKYKVGNYNKFMIYDPKEREIQAIGYRDRVVQHCICDNYLTPLLNRYLIYDNCACRKNKGTSFAIARLKKFMSEFYKRNGTNGYFVKLDVKKYFPSINHDLLKQKLAKIVDNKQILALLFQIIDSYNKEQNIGLPMGNQTSQSFALLYLDVVDRCIKEKLKIKYYLRYMDDMIVLVDNKKIANDCIENVSNLINFNRLMLNTKSQAILAKNGIIFLGWRFFWNNKGKVVQKIAFSAKKRIIDKVKRRAFEQKCKMKTDDDLNSTMASYNGYLKKGNTNSFVLKIQSILVKG